MLHFRALRKTFPPSLNDQPRRHIMATASTIQLASDGAPVYYRPGLTDDLAKKASELLQTNHDRYHIFFNNDGFHNHIAHQTLSLYALNASKENLQRAYDANASYQRRSAPVHRSIVEELDDPAKFLSYLGPDKYYNDYLAFFTKSIERDGWQETLQKYLFNGDERAETMLVRIFAGFLRMFAAIDVVLHCQLIHRQIQSSIWDSAWSSSNRQSLQRLLRRPRATTVGSVDFCCPQSKQLSTIQARRALRSFSTRFEPTETFPQLRNGVTATKSATVSWLELANA